MKFKAALCMESMFGAVLACHLHERFNTITTTINAAT
jgi:hypothetical protein